MQDNCFAPAIKCVPVRREVMCYYKQHRSCQSDGTANERANLRAAPFVFTSNRGCRFAWTRSHKEIAGDLLGSSSCCFSVGY